MTKLYVEGFGKRIKAQQISKACGTWMVGGSSFEDLAQDTVWYEPLENGEVSTDTETSIIGEETFEFALKLAEELGHATLPASEADTIGRIVVFADNSSSGLPSVQACVDALGLHPHVAGMNLVLESTMTPRNWHARLAYGFCFQDEEDFEEASIYKGRGNEQRILATTELMADGLTDHFEYNMTESIVCAPVLYGGRHKNNSNAIVAVLSMRVWT